MSIDTIIQKTTVDGISSVVVTDITQDPTTNLYVRELRLMDMSQPNPLLQFTLRLVSTSRAALELTAPSQTF